LSVSVANDGQIALDCAAGCSRKVILKALRLRPRELTPLSQSQMRKALREQASNKVASVPFPLAYYQAWVSGLLKIIHRTDPHMAKRHIQAMSEVDKEFRSRWLRRDPKVFTWVLDELADGPLADLRTNKSLPHDKALVEQYDRLRRELTPLFGAHSIIQRNQKVASVVTNILGRPISPEKFPQERTISEFCCALLRTTPVNISRARRRLRSWAHRNNLRLLDNLGQLVHLIPRLPKDVADEHQARLKRGRKGLDVLFGPSNP
jgi:hypothetical protein